MILFLLISRGSSNNSALLQHTRDSIVVIHSAKITAVAAAAVGASRQSRPRNPLLGICDHDPEAAGRCSSSSSPLGSSSSSGIVEKMQQKLPFKRANIPVVAGDDGAVGQNTLDVLSSDPLGFFVINKPIHPEDCGQIHVDLQPVAVVAQQSPVDRHLQRQR